MKRNVLFFLTSIFVFILMVFNFNKAACTAAKTVKVTSLKVANIDYTNYYSMRETGTLKIKTLIEPKNASNKNLTWTSSDKTIAEVDNIRTRQFYVQVKVYCMFQMVQRRHIL